MGNDTVLAEALSEDQHDLLVSLMKVTMTMWHLININWTSNAPPCDIPKEAEKLFADPVLSYWWSGLQDPDNDGVWTWMYCELSTTSTEWFTDRPWWLCICSGCLGASWLEQLEPCSGAGAREWSRLYAISLGDCSRSVYLLCDGGTIKIKVFFTCPQMAPGWRLSAPTTSSKCTLCACCPTEPPHSPARNLHSECYLSLCLLIWPGHRPYVFSATYS